MDTSFKDNNQLNEYYKEFNNDINLTTVNLREKSLLLSSIRSKWLAYLYKEKENLDRIRTAKRTILEKKTKNTVPTSVLKLKNETVVAENDEKIQKLNSLQKLTETNIEYLERCQNILADFGFYIKNTIEILKMEKM